MRFLLVILGSVIGSNALSVPIHHVDEKPSPVIHARQAVVTPPPCVAISPPPTEEETQARFTIFGDAFLVEKNLTRAFEYISSTYIVSHCQSSLS